MRGEDKNGHAAALAAALTMAFLLALATAFAIGVQLSGQPEAYPSYEDIPNNNKAGTQQVASESLQREGHKRPCRNPRSRDESDLCAQYRAAHAARDSANWAYVQIALSAFGLLGLGGTIFLTIRATNAAVESNRIARETGKQQLRAYVNLDSDFPITVQPHAVLRASPIIRNTGETPARVKRWVNFTRCVSLPLVEPLEPASPFPDAPSVLDLGKGQTSRTELVGSAPLAPSLFSQLANGSLGLFLWGEVEYADVFGETHHTKYRLKFDVASGSFRHCEEGSESD